ncbi:transmembrane protein, putative, partial [Bodo saltans]
EEVRFDNLLVELVWPILKCLEVANQQQATPTSRRIPLEGLAVTTPRNQRQSITSAGGPGGDGSNNSSHGGSGGGGSGGRQQQLVAFRRIANYLDISTPAGTLHSAIPAWILSSAWCILRIAVAAHGYVGRRTLYKYTDRPVYDYAYIYQIIAASLLQVAVLHHIWIFFHRREQFGYATTAVYIQGIVSGSIMVYADRLMYGTGAIVS